MRHKADNLMGIRNKKCGINGTVQIGFLSREIPNNHGKLQAYVKPWKVWWDRKEKGIERDRKGK